MEPLPQPDFQLLTQSLTTVVEQISLVPNIPTVSDGQTITQLLRQITQSLTQQGEQIRQQGEQIRQQGEQIRQQGEQIRQQGEQITTILNTVTTIQAEVRTIKDRIADLDLRLDASETNGQARLYNSTITNTETAFLSIHDRRSRPVDGFPENGRALARLTGDELSALLEAYNQPTDGSVSAKRKRFRRFIGVMVEI